MWVRARLSESPGAGVIAASITPPPPMAAYHNGAPRSLSAVRFLSGMAAARFLLSVVTDDSLIAERPRLFPNLTLSSAENARWRHDAALSYLRPISRSRSHICRLFNSFNAVSSHIFPVFTLFFDRSIRLSISISLSLATRNLYYRQTGQQGGPASSESGTPRFTRLRHRQRDTCQFAASFDPGSSE